VGHSVDAAGERGVLSPCHLVVLALARQALYTPFDAAIGHFRRYGMAHLLSVGTEGMRVCRARYLDSSRLLAVLGNGLLLCSAQPAGDRSASGTG